MIVLGYKVKWVEENLGVTRKALRIFEREGLMPQNKNGQYRDYSEEDIERIWFIRVMQGMGYSLKEIANIALNVHEENWDFQDSITQKIVELERKKADIERHLGYAKTIKLTGRFPSRPKEIGTIRFEDFYEKALEGWNINNDPRTEHLSELTDLILNQPAENWKNSDLDSLFGFLDSLKLTEMNPDIILSETILPKAILKRKNLGTAHPEIQLLIKLIYENQLQIAPELQEMTPQQFARYQSSAYRDGDIAKIKEKEYGKENCKFIADAIAIFGGFSDSDDPRLF